MARGIKSAGAVLQSHLSSMTGAPSSIIHDNVDTSRPAELYLTTHVLDVTTDYPIDGEDPKYTGLFQVSVFGVKNAGAGAALDMADLIAARFGAWSSIYSADISVWTRDVTIAAPYVDDGRYIVPITIEFYSYS